MKTKSMLICFLIASPLSLSSCFLTSVLNLNSSPIYLTTGDWVQSVPFRGIPRSRAITFTIGDQVFAGLGYNGNEYLSDFYLYDDGIWKLAAPFPGIPRGDAVSFSIKDKGYVGLGSFKSNDGSITYLNDFWEYDSFNNKWKQLNDFTGGKRDGAIAVAIQQKGYLGTGYDGVKWLNDFWEYTATTDSWEQIKTYPSAVGRRSASAFVMNGKIFLLGGRNDLLYISDLWEFDPTNKEWTDRSQSSTSDNYSDFKAAVKRSNAVAFAFKDKAYIALGASPSLTLTIYECDPSTYRWTQKSNFEGSIRQNAIWFITNHKAFVGTGETRSSYYDDVWEWRPDEDW
jgi:N-acetylneuraminic acid mutarotase